MGGHPALDLLNTRCTPHEETIDFLVDGRALLDWMIAARVIDEADAARLRRHTKASELDACAEQARRLREWARSWVARWRLAPAADYAREITTLNRLLARATSHRELVQREGQLVLDETRRITSSDDVIALLAEHIASLVANEAPTLVKQCAGPKCTITFVDRTKSHARVFCSASVCGNRAKVAAFRARHR
jgi:predicted RNA-binding Zn ribbon-like protein